jgi:hypothetical protein
MKYISIIFLSIISVISCATVDFPVHEIGYLNLGDNPLVNILCKDVKTFSCPNFLVLESGNEDTVISNTNNDIHFSGNFLASIISTIGAPSNVFSYYTAQSEMKADFDNVDNFLAYRNINALFSANGSVEVMAYLIDEAFEFSSFDSSGIYNVKNDEIKQTISYYNVLWNEMEVNSQSPKDITYAIVSSKDNNHKFTWIMSGTYANFKNGTILTPVSTKLNIDINFPFNYSDTFLGLRMFVCSANAVGAIKIETDIENNELKGGNSYLSWMPKAFSDSGEEIGVHVSVGDDIEAHILTRENNLFHTINGMLKADGSVEAFCKVQYFSFSKTNGPVLWESYIGNGYNPNENKNPSLSTAQIVIISAIGAVILGILGITCFIVYRSRRTNLNSGESFYYFL